MARRSDVQPRYRDGRGPRHDRREGRQELTSRRSDEHDGLTTCPKGVAIDRHALTIDRAPVIYNRSSKNGSSLRRIQRRRILNGRHVLTT